MKTGQDVIQCHDELIHTKLEGEISPYFWGSVLAWVFFPESYELERCEDFSYTFRPHIDYLLVLSYRYGNPLAGAMLLRKLKNKDTRLMKLVILNMLSQAAPKTREQMTFLGVVAKELSFCESSYETKEYQSLKGLADVFFKQASGLGDPIAKFYLKGNEFKESIKAGCVRALDYAIQSGSKEYIEELAKRDPAGLCHLGVKTKSLDCFVTAATEGYYQAFSIGCKLLGTDNELYQLQLESGYTDDKETFFNKEHIDEIYNFCNQFHSVIKVIL
jgi:hypothetical protein